MSHEDILCWVAGCPPYAYRTSWSEGVNTSLTQRRHRTRPVFENVPWLESALYLAGVPVEEAR
eukprot:3694564-Amphidinium_carterae.1